MLEKNKIYCMDCIKGMKKLDDNSVDSIVTDPPYGLGFMGKQWDTYDKTQFGRKDNEGKNDLKVKKNFKVLPRYRSDSSFYEFSYAWSKEALRVLKPGGHLLSFGGTRTYHRMACAIEDAGFEIRDMIQWVYGCLSEDTEILTPLGWVPYHRAIKFKNSLYPILIYDIEKNIYKWEIPKRWNEYNIYKDTCYRIKSNKTDQLVSRNHRCLVEREGEFKFIQAENLKSMENMPTLSDDFYKLQEQQRKILFKEMQRLLQGSGMEKMGQDRKFNIQSSKIQNKKRTQRFKESCLERWGNLFQKKGKLWQIQDKICSLSNGIYNYGKKGWLYNGTPIDNGKTFEQMFIKNRSSSSQRSQSRKQQIRESNVIQNQSCLQNLRGYTFTNAKITKEEYTGIVFCPTVSTGCFIARRKGKIFITGNSGFPKSHNIGKAVDKLQGNERKDLGKDPNARDGGGSIKVITKNKNQRITKGNSKWEGWGTALKPANEPIVVARKPLSEKTIVKNVLKWGTAGINIDDCRINLGEVIQGGGNGKSSDNIKFSSKKRPKVKSHTNGRFPANVIHDGSDEVVRLFPNTKSTGGRIGKKDKSNIDFGLSGNYKKGDPGFGDSGSAARFFYCAKASKSERNKGLKGFKPKKRDKSRKEGNPGGDNPRNRGVKKVKNTHPTVKPLKLMKYLVRLVTPSQGCVLDPFMGSGTTGMAAKSQNFDYIGFDMAKEYCKIARARINSIDRQKKIGDYK